MQLNTCLGLMDDRMALNVSELKKLYYSKLYYICANRVLANAKKKLSKERAVFCISSVHWQCDVALMLTSSSLKFEMM